MEERERKAIQAVIRQGEDIESAPDLLDRGRVLDRVLKSLRSLIAPVVAPYYLAECSSCGWSGSSEFCSSGLAGDECACPLCSTDCDEVARSFYDAWCSGAASIADVGEWAGNLGLDEKELSDYSHGRRCLQTILYEKRGFWEKNSGRF